MAYSTWVLALVQSKLAALLCVMPTLKNSPANTRDDLCSNASMSAVHP